MSSGIARWPVWPDQSRLDDGFHSSGWPISALPAKTDMASPEFYCIAPPEFRAAHMLSRRHTAWQPVALPLPTVLYLAKAGGKMTTDIIEKLITNSIHTAFIKYPEGDGGPQLDYEWIAPEQSSHIARAILMDLEANG